MGLQEDIAKLQNVKEKKMAPKAPAKPKGGKTPNDVGMKKDKCKDCDKPKKK
jgi:hypothetical protein